MAQFTIQGNTFDFVYRAGPNYGLAELWVDGTKMASVDQYAENQTPEESVTVWVGAGSHMLEIRRAGRKNVESSGYEVNLDKLVVYDVAATNAPTNTPIPSDTPTVTPTPTAPTAERSVGFDGFEVGNARRAAGYSGSYEIQTDDALYSDYGLKFRGYTNHAELVIDEATRHLGLQIENVAGTSWGTIEAESILTQEDVAVLPLFHSLFYVGE